MTWGPDLDGTAVAAGATEIICCCRGCIYNNAGPAGAPLTDRIRAQSTLAEPFELCAWSCGSGGLVEHAFRYFYTENTVL